MAQTADNVHIWNATIALIRDSLLLTQPSSPDSEVDDTPFRITSATPSPSDESRKAIETLLRDEVGAYTFQQVEGFYAKYFEGKHWDDYAKEIWEAARHWHNGGRWMDITHPPTQTKVEMWCLRFQDCFLANRGEVRGAYSTDPPEDMYGNKLKLQPDLSFPASYKEPSTNHNWKQVAVVGELKQSGYDPPGCFYQICRYVRGVFAHQPTRRYVHAFSVTGSRMQTWVFDRSGAYSDEDFDIHEYPGKCVQIICGYVLMSDEELGFDTFTDATNDKLSIGIPDQFGQTLELELRREPIAVQNAIVCRGTTCYLAKESGTEDYNYVVKYSWASGKRQPEHELLAWAYKHGVQGVPRLVAHCDVTSTHDLREGIHLFPRAPWYRQKEKAY